MRKNTDFSEKDKWLKRNLRSDIHEPGFIFKQSQKSM